MREPVPEPRTPQACKIEGRRPAPASTRAPPIRMCRWRSRSGGGPGPVPSPPLSMEEAECVRQAADYPRRGVSAL